MSIGLVLVGNDGTALTNDSTVPHGFLVDSVPKPGSSLHDRVRRNLPSLSQEPPPSWSAGSSIAWNTVFWVQRRIRFVHLGIGSSSAAFVFSFVFISVVVSIFLRIVFVSVSIFIDRQQRFELAGVLANVMVFVVAPTDATVMIVVIGSVACVSSGW